MRAFRFASPVVGADVLFRPRLLAALSQRWHRRVVVLKAGPGFGKTTLLAQAAEEAALEAAGTDVWITCEPADVSGVGLTRDLARALGLHVADDEVVAVGRVTAAIWQRAPEEVAVLLDDVHLLQPHTPGAEILAELASSLPGNGHVVLAGRSDPPVPLARWKAQGEVVVIDEDDLRLTADEVAALAERRSVDADTLAAVGGWPALTELALSAGAETAREFMWEEVLDHMGPEQRRDFAAFVVAGGGDAEVAAAAAGHPVDLDALVDGVPLVARRASGAADPHSLWSDVAVAELGADEVRAAQRRAAQALYGRGDHDRAIELWAMAQDWERVSTAVVEACIQGGPLLVERQSDRWLQLLPDDEAHGLERVLLAGISGCVRRPGDSSVREQLRNVAEQFRSGGRGDGEIAALYHLGYLAWLRHDVEELAWCLQRGIELEEQGSGHTRFLRPLGEALFAGRMGDYETARSRLEDLTAQRLTTEWEASIASFLAMTLSMLGRSEDAVDHARRAAARPGSAGMAIMLHLNQWFAGHPEPVLAALPLPGSDSASVYDRILARLVSAMALAHVGRIEAADVEVRALSADLQAYPQRMFTEAALAFVRASIAAAGGREREAADILRAFLAEHPLDDVGVESSFRRLHPLVYVLVPETRSFWDAQRYGPAWEQAREVARSLVAVREGKEVARLGVPPGRVLTSLPVPLAVELALGVGDGGDLELLGWLLDRWGSATRDALREKASGQGGVATRAKATLRSVAVPPEQPVRVELLGPARLWRGAELVDDRDWQREKVRLLLLYLTVHPRASRDEVATVLWPDFDPEAAAGNLRTTLRYLNRLLEPERGQGDATFFIRQDGPYLVLHPGDHLVIDAREFEARLADAEAAEASASPSQALEHLLAALSVWRGDYLDDARYEEWALPHQDRLRARFVQAGVRAGELLVPIGRAGEAIELATQVLTFEPWSEAAYRALMLAHLQAGDRASARRAVERCREMLDDLDVAAEAPTARAIRAVLEAPADPSVPSG